MSKQAQVIQKRVHSRKKKKQEQEFLERAFKGAPRPTTPAGEIAALERYMQELRRLEDEIIRRNGNDIHYQSGLYWIYRELDDAATAIIRKKIQILRDERNRI